MNNKIVYNNGTVQFHMFILVSMPLGFVTGGLSGSSWSTFWYLQVGREFFCVLCTGCSPEQNQKIKKVDSLVAAFFYNEVTFVGQFGNMWSSLVEQAVQSWLAGLILCLVHAVTSYCTISCIFKFESKIWIIFQRARMSLRCPVVLSKNILLSLTLSQLLIKYQISGNTSVRF